MTSIKAWSVHDTSIRNDLLSMASKQDPLEQGLVHSLPAKMWEPDHLCGTASKTFFSDEDYEGRLERRSSIKEEACMV